MLMNMQKKEHGTCSFGVGIEAGMFSVPEVETKYMDSSICAIYDGWKDVWYRFGQNLYHMLNP